MLAAHSECFYKEGSPEGVEPPDAGFSQESGGDKEYRGHVGKHPCVRPWIQGGDSNDSTPSLSLGMLRTKEIVSTAFKPVMHQKDVRHPQSDPIRVSAGIPVA